MKIMHVAALGCVLLLADHYFFDGKYREIAWSGLKSAGIRLNAELARISPTFSGR
jgi:hypothetical protein